MWEFSYTIFLLVLSTFICMWIIARLLMDDNVLYINKRRRNHNWKFIKILNRSCFCSICEILIPASIGLFCDCCGVCSHPSCVRSADKKLQCKDAVVEKTVTFKHQWIKGNLPLDADCFICNGDIDYHTEPGLYGFRCCWCNRSVHKKCFTKVIADERCDFGEFNDMIIPPYSLILGRSRSSPKLHLEKIQHPNNIDYEWKPLIIIANVKSGSSAGLDILSLFRGLLNPLQVMELSTHGPIDALQWAIKLHPAKCRILVAGGDGTVGWVLNTIHKMKIEPVPEVSIIPLGTGNDLSRVLGWGSSSSSEFDPITFLRKIRQSQAIALDRWEVKLTGSPYRFPIQKFKQRSIHIYNYFSVGVDAQVTLNFHKARDSLFHLLSSRIVNKILYLCFGTHQVVQQDCFGLEKHVQLYLDDEVVELPELQSIICSNIDSWGAGVKLWEMSQSPGDNRDHSVSDGKMEVFGVVSSFHIAQLQVGLSKPIRLGQAKKVRIISKQSLPVQADGEPWVQKPCVITIENVNQAVMIKNSGLDLL